MNARKFVDIAACTLGLAAFSVAAFAGPAQARSMGAASGKAVFSNNGSCFNVNFGGVANICTSGGQRLYEVPLPSDSTGQKSVNISVTGDATCYAYAVDRSTLNQDNGDFGGVFSEGPASIVTFNNMTLNAFGNLVAGCGIGPSGRMLSVTWNQ